jgi:prepilin-type N-terminal cleavage/methylation domain-containing protein/prepilin-type processing-associated H-X9-DG protein
MTPGVKSRQTPRGLTLIEILVVVSIIALLAALLFAAIQASREGARRAVCGNKLRQIGLATQQYISTHGVLPLDWNEGNGHSFLVALLPYLDQKPLYDSINMNAPVSGTVGNTRVSVFSCPSDGFVRLGPEGSTNYAGNRGAGVQAFGYNGAFSFMTAVRPQDFTDGMNSTSAVSEWIVGPNTGTTRDAKRSVFTTISAWLGKTQLEDFAAACRKLDVNTAQLTPAVVGVPWTHGDFGHSLYNHVIEINGASCLNGSRWQEGAWTAKSFHNNGVNTLFADGNVRFLRSTLDLAVWRALASRNGGEIVQGDAL